MKRSCITKISLCLLVLVTALVFSGCFLFPDSPGNGGGDPAPPPDDDGGDVIDISPNAVDFTLRSLDGGNFSLNDYWGKPIWIVFLHRDCMFCRQEAPVMEKMYQKYNNSQELVVIGIATPLLNNPANMSMLQEYKNSYGLTFPLLLDGDAQVRNQFFSGFGVPAMVFIDRRGEVSFRRRGYMDEETVESVLHTIF